MKIKLPKSSFSQKLIYCIFIQFFCCWSIAAPLPAENLYIQANIPVIPESWEAVTWESDDNDLYIIAQAPMKDAEGEALKYKFDLVVTAKPKIELLEPIPSTLNKEISSDSLDAEGKILLTPYKVKAPENDEGGNIYLVIIEGKIKRVAFTDALILTSDHENKPYKADDYHWIDDNLDGEPDADGASTYLPDKVKSYPCSYVRKKPVNIKAKFKVNNPKLKKIWVKGESKGDSELKFKELEIELSGGEGIYEKKSDGDLVDTVRAYITKNRGTPWDIDDPLKIKWKISLDGKKWIDGGETKHTIYVTLLPPDTAFRQETIFNLSTRNANGETEEKIIFKAVYKDFEDREVLRMDGKTMKYWNPVDANCFAVETMLGSIEANGTCNAWAEILLETMKAQGIKDVKTVLVEPDFTKLPRAVNFLVKKWKFGQSIANGVNKTHESTRKGNDIELFAKGAVTTTEVVSILPGPDTTIKSDLLADDRLVDGGESFFIDPEWPYTPLPFLYGVSPVSLGRANGSCKPDKIPDAQGNDIQTPQSFNLHWIIKYDGKFYDPSYGTKPIANENDFENSVCAGFEAASPMFGSVIRKNDPAVQEMTFKETTLPEPPTP